MISPLRPYLDIPYNALPGEDSKVQMNGVVHHLTKRAGMRIVAFKNPILLRLTQYALGTLVDLLPMLLIALDPTYNGSPNINVVVSIGLVVSNIPSYVIRLRG